MRIVVQRVREASVSVAGEVVGAIGPGLLLLVGITHADEEGDLEYLAEKVLGLRIFSDALDKMNLSVRDVGGSLLVVSQFTLYGDCQKGKRPSFVAAAEPEQAQLLFDRFVDRLRAGDVPVATGRFGAMMEVRLLNDGPVTLIVESLRTANAIPAERVPKP